MTEYQFLGELFKPARDSECPPHPPLHGHGTDVPPAPVKAAGGLLDRVALGVTAAGVDIVEQDVTKRQDRRHALRVLLDVPLQILQATQNINSSVSNTGL